MKGFLGISEGIVRTRTGKASNKWYEILDKWGAKEKGHTLTARHLRERYRLSDWWAQCVTIRYEWARGLRTKTHRDEG